MLRYCVIFFSLLCFSFLGQAKTSQPYSTEAMAVEILSYINDYRVSKGLPRLMMNQTMNQEAMQHSREMSLHLVPVGHAGFNQRMLHLKRKIHGVKGGAENVAYNYKNARIVTEGWIASRGHRQNILGPYTMTGIGVVRDRFGHLYFTQLFLRV